MAKRVFPSSGNRDPLRIRLDRKLSSSHIFLKQCDRLDLRGMRQPEKRMLVVLCVGGQAVIIQLTPQGVGELLRVIGTE